MAVIDTCIEPGITVISDCWGAYRDLDAEGYTYRTVNHIIGCIDEGTGSHTNISEHVESCEGFSEPLQQEGGLHTSPSSLHVRGEVQGRESGLTHKVPSPRRHNLLERMFKPFRIVVRLPPIFHRLLRLQPQVEAHVRSNNSYRVIFWVYLRTIQKRPQHHPRQTATSLHTFSM